MMALHEKWRCHQSYYKWSWQGNGIIVFESFSKTHKCEHHGGATWKIMGSPVELIPWEPWISVKHFVPIHPVDIKIFNRIKVWPMWSIAEADQNVISMAGTLYLMVNQLNKLKFWPDDGA